MFVGKSQINQKNAQDMNDCYFPDDIFNCIFLNENV